MSEKTQLFGRILLEASIEVVTGLYIGGSGGGLEIGGVENTIIRNPLNQQPYIPGSSLRGKMRSQLEKALGLLQNNPIGKVRIHTCQTEAKYEENGGCPVCHIFGVPGEGKFPGLTRLIVRDVYLDSDSEVSLKKITSGLLYTEIKTEVAIDRITSQASPRSLERVPAGTVFSPAELVFSVYEPADLGRFKYVMEGLQLVEDDYLGGYGSRGSGKVHFSRLTITVRSGRDYTRRSEYPTEFADLKQMAAGFEALSAWLAHEIPFS